MEHRDRLQDLDQRAEQPTSSNISYSVADAERR